MTNYREILRLYIASEAVSAVLPEKYRAPEILLLM